MMIRYFIIFSLLFPVIVLVSGKERAHSALTANWLGQDRQPVTVEIFPHNIHQETPNKPYRLTSEGLVRVVLKNETDQRVKAVLVDTYYQNRPRLYKDGKLLPYRGTVTKLIASKDNDPEFVRIGSVVFIEPYSSVDAEDLKLSDWYGPLEPGSYRLTNRHRLDVDSPWSLESAELRFEVATKQ